MERLQDSLGPEENAWRWGDLHQIAFWHRQRKRAGFEHLTVGPDPIGGSPTTLGMAMHMGKGLEGLSKTKSLVVFFMVRLIAWSLIWETTNMHVL